MRSQDPIKELTQAERSMAERYRYFRTKYVDPTMSVAAKELEVSQSYLSKIEAAKIKISARGTRVMIEEYFLNSKWLATGKGDERIVPKENDTLLGKNISELRNMITTLSTKVLTIEKQMEIVKKTEDFFIKRIEDYMKREDVLTSQLEKALKIIENFKG